MSSRRFVSIAIISALVLAVWGCGSEPGQACDQCPAEGTTRCDGAQIQSCELDGEGCLVWTEATDCGAAGEICDDTGGTAACVSLCTDDCPAAGDTQCNGDVIEECAEGADGCLHWNSGTDCATSGDLCDDSGATTVCVSTCTDECPAAGDSQCSGTIIEDCAEGMDGCLDWTAGTDCATSGEFCEDTGGTAICVSTCSDDCVTMGDTQCNGTVIEDCAVGGDGCLDWNAGTDCATSGEACDDAGGTAACVTTCTDDCPAAGDSQCNGTVIETCSLGGDGCLDWTTGTDCASSGEFCDDSGATATCVTTCTDDCPAAGDSQCNGTVIETCSLGGDGCLDWTTGTDCASSGELCEDTSGTATCVNTCSDDCPTVGDSQCNGEVIETCGVGGDGCLDWNTGTDCAASGEVCDDSGATAICITTCTDDCPSAGDSQCNGTVIETCAVGGDGCLDWSPGTDCASSGESCNDSSGTASCVTPCNDDCPSAGFTYCDGTTLQTCTLGGNGCLHWTPGAACGTTGTGCGWSTAMPQSFDLPLTTLGGAITMDGAALPANAENSGGGSFYLRHNSTDALHSIGGYVYTYSGGQYVVYTDTIDAKVIAGTYDLLYRRGWSSTTNTIPANDPADVLVDAYVTLTPDVVVSQGSNTFDVDLPLATLSGAITMDGAPLPVNAENSGGGTFYLRHNPTGALHSIGGYVYTYSGGQYVVYIDTIDAKVIAGTYDLLYRRGWSSTTNTTPTNDPADVLVDAYVTLTPDVVVSQGTNTFDVDLPLATLSGAITMDGAPLPVNAENSGGGTFYLRHNPTGALHSIGGYVYTYSGGQYVVYIDTIDAKVIAGTYDLLYRRGWSSTTNTTPTNDPADVLVDAYVMLTEDVAVSQGAATFDVDLPLATISGMITMDGVPLPGNAENSGGGTFYLRHNATGALHSIGGYVYTYSGGQYVVYTDTIDAKVIAGTYDLLYRRGWSSTTNTTPTNDPADVLVDAYVLLTEDLVISPGANVLNPDLPLATVSGMITMDGLALPATAENSGGGTFYLRHNATGALHSIGGYVYTYSGGQYVVYTDTIDAKVIAGTYDLLYRRGWSSTTNTVPTNDPADVLVDAYVLLTENLVVSPGANVLNPDLPQSLVGGSITMDGQPLPANAENSGGGSFYLRHPNTGALHSIGGYVYTYSGGQYVVYTDTIDAKVVSGIYDLIYRRGWSSTTNTTPTNDPADVLIDSYTLLQPCVLVP